MKPYPTQRQKTQRAYRAYVDLIDTAKWIENELRGPLWTHDLTMGEFRLLELLYREGALTLSDVIRRRQVKRQNIMVVVKRLRKRGWVERVDVTLPPVPGSQKKVGRWASVVGLTKPGKRFIGNILPTHSKLVKALMRAIDGRQQETLSLICRKLRAGDPVRFFVEITHEDED
jgi:MarR family transcriptional regulator, 2-MHQ and catechol-resistance regulon repressor